MKYSKHSLAALALLCAHATATAIEITITQPLDGSDVTDTLTVQGSSDMAQIVELQVNDEPFQTANGTDQWNVVLEPGSMPPGEHVLTARATDADGVEAFDSVSINVIDLTTGTQRFTYTSSVDGEEMGLELFLPDNYDSTMAPTGLVVYLHGGGGTGVIPAGFQAGLNERNWIAVAPDGRQWGLADLGCNWRTSAGYVDSDDPNVGPGEQDILDAVDWAMANFSIDADRVYLTGHSMGGRGAYIIGLKNPDRFAAIAPLAPAIDMYEVFVRRPEPAACKEGMVGGQPHDSPKVDTMYTITSGRFLIENAYNLPVFHGHGLNDRVASNTTTESPFLHGFHITLDSSWDGCFIGDSELCFDHTPTLTELSTRHPDGYDWAYMFTPAEHRTDPLWLDGTPASPDVLGVEDPLNPGQLLGMYDFFDQRTLVHSPDTVVFKSYTDTHRKAYWAQIDITEPWLNTPGAIRATRDSAANGLALELSRVATAQIDLTLAQLALTDDQPLTVTVEPLQETVFDPALTSTAPLTPTLVLTGDFTALAAVEVLQDGMPLDGALIHHTETMVTIGPVSASVATALTIAIADNVQINEPPVADAGMDQTVSEDESVTLNGGDSMDPESGVLTYLWEQTDGMAVALTNADTATASFTAPQVSADELLMFQLTVTDDNGQEHSDSVTVTITDAATNQPPVAHAGDDTDVTENDRLMLDATASHDPEGGDISFQWAQLEGPPTPLQDDATGTPHFTAPEVDVDMLLTFQVTVTDSDGLSSTDTVNVLINNRSLLEEIGGAGASGPASLLLIGLLFMVRRLTADNGRRR